jgi:DMSO/TMAO reductase YedYZ heme-binding membrane subunit
MAVRGGRTTWLGWLQQLTSVVYLIAGLFLLYQYWKNLHRQMVLIVGLLFVVYSIYRFFLVRRSLKRSAATEERE